MDVIDVAQRRQMEDIELALATREPARMGLSHCENAECGEPIIALRQQMGARLCIDCARDAERKAKQCARGAV